jgi:hypothetical protein
MGTAFSRIHQGLQVKVEAGSTDNLLTQRGSSILNTKWFSFAGVEMVTQLHF